MNPPRILQVITRSDWGGAPRIVESLATKIEEVDAVACGPGGLLIERLKEAGITVHVQPHLQSSPTPRDVHAYHDLRQLIAEENFDLVHSHSTKASALARIAAVRTDTPCVVTVHGWGFYNTEYGPLQPVVVKGEQLLGARTDEIVCVSENDYREGQRHNIIPPNKGTVIHNGIPSLEYSSGRNTLYNEFDIEQGTPIVGAIARLAPQKDPLRLLEVARQLVTRGREFATVLIGSGPLKQDCETFVEDHDMDNVFLPGFRHDALELLPDFDVFLLPSRFEGFPLTVLECLHAGVPLVAHEVGGVGEAVDDGITGYIVSPNHDESIYVDRVESLLEDPELRQRMSQQAKQIALARFTEERMVGEYRDVYDQILQ